MIHRAIRRRNAVSRAPTASTLLVTRCYYLRREINNSPSLRETDVRKQPTRTTEAFSWAKVLRRAVAPRNRYYAAMILQGYSRPTHISLSVSGRLFHLLLRELAIEDDTVWKRSDVIYWDRNCRRIKTAFTYILFFFIFTPFNFRHVALVSILASRRTGLHFGRIHSKYIHTYLHDWFKLRLY